MKIIDMAKFYFGQYETLEINGEYATGLRGKDKVYGSLDEFLADWEGWADMEVVQVCFQTVYTGYSDEYGKSVPTGDFETPHLYFMYR
jgi:hypothetical protein